MIPTSYPSDTNEADLPLHVGDEIAFFSGELRQEGKIVEMKWLDGDDGDIEAIEVVMDTGWNGIVWLEEIEDGDDDPVIWCINDPCECEATHYFGKGAYLCATCAQAYIMGQNNRDQEVFPIANS